MTADRSAAGVDSGPIVRGSGENPGEGNVDSLTPCAPPPDVARLVGQIAPPERVDPVCSECSGPLALATGVCVSCGHDEFDYYDDMPDLACPNCTHEPRPPVSIF